MRFYGLSYWDVMDTPIRAFWELNRNVDRIAAEEERRRFETEVTAASGNGETIQKYAESLHNQMGAVIVEKARLDREGLHALKGLGRGA